jgi:protein-S-isoprenylcysteine O-methyltransferase Ste14
MPHAKRIKNNKIIKKDGKAREKVLMFIAAIGMMIIPIIWIFTDIFKNFNMNLPEWLRYIGILLSIFGLWLFYSVHKTLGRNWSPVLEIREKHTLIREGPYKRIRHPMYTQIWIWMFTLFFFTSNWFVGIAGIICWSILYFIRVPKEERMMEEEFGDEYIQYKKETGRIIPKLKFSI